MDYLQIKMNQQYNISDFFGNLIEKVEFKVGDNVLQTHRICQKCHQKFDQQGYDDEAFKYFRIKNGYKGNIKLCIKCDS